MENMNTCKLVWVIGLSNRYAIRVCFSADESDAGQDEHLGIQI